MDEKWGIWCQSCWRNPSCKQRRKDPCTRWPFAREWTPQASVYSMHTNHPHASGPHKRVHIQHTISIHMRVDPTGECIFNACQSSTCEWTPQASVYSMHANHPHASGPHRRVYIQCIPIIHMRVDPTGECIFNAYQSSTCEWTCK